MAVASSIAPLLLGNWRRFQTTQDKVGTAEVAKLMEILLKMTDLSLPCSTGMLIGKKTLQPQLTVSPIPYNVIVFIQDLTVSFLKSFRVPAVFMILDQFIRNSLYFYSLHLYRPRPVPGLLLCYHILRQTIMSPLHSSIPS